MKLANTFKCVWIDRNACTGADEVRRLLMVASSEKTTDGAIRLDDFDPAFPDGRRPINLYLQIINPNPDAEQIELNQEYELILVAK